MTTAPDKVVGPFTRWNPDIQRSDTIKLDDLEITFNRFIPAPDSSSGNDMPPSIGLFPLFNASDHAAKVPAKIAQKGDLALTMSQREALSVSFSSQKEYTIKIYAGSVHAVSGELAVDTTGDPLHRLNLLEGKDSIQEYTVVPSQDSGSRVAGDDTVGILHFEVSRLDRPPTETVESQSQGPRYAIELQGLFSNFFFSVHDGTPVKDLCFTLSHCGCKFRDFDNPDRPRWRVLYGGKPLPATTITDDTLGDLKVRDGDTFQASIDRHSIVGMPGYPEHGDSSRSATTVTFNVQILNSAALQEVTGNPPTPSPVPTETGIEEGSPF